MLLRGHQAIFQGSQRRSMATNPNDIKKRIKGTQAIKKITKSMQMVSAAKLKGDELRMKKGMIELTKRLCDCHKKQKKI